MQPIKEQAGAQLTIEILERALKTDPRSASLHNDLGNAYKKVGNFEKAAQHYHEALRIDPHHAESFNNIGHLFYIQGLYQEAIPLFERALGLDPHYWQAHYNLAHSLVRQNQSTSAIAHYKAALQLNSEHPNTHFNLGLLYYEAQEYTDAKEHLEKACLLLDDKQAKQTALKFLSDTELALGNIDAAMQALEDALKIASDPDIEHNLGVLHLRKEEKTKALTHFKKAYELQPQNKTAEHLTQALEGQQSTKAPNAYIADLFNQYADYYDRHVKEKLHYDVPGLLRSALGRCLPQNPHIGRVLDLGCGTGLCGIYFRDLAFTFIGVDISPKMVEKAKLLNAYDEVICAEMIEYLESPNLAAFDLIIAADVFVYTGDLAPLFKAIISVLNPEGRFAFTTEYLETGTYFLQTSGRYSHSVDYIHTLATQYHFAIELEENISLREHEGKGIEGRVFILQKT